VGGEEGYFVGAIEGQVVEGVKVAGDLLVGALVAGVAEGVMDGGDLEGIVEGIMLEGDLVVGALVGGGAEGVMVVCALEGIVVEGRMVVGALEGDVMLVEGFELGAGEKGVDVTGPTVLGLKKRREKKKTGELSTTLKQVNISAFLK
jgi:hypothetical protein